MKRIGVEFRGEAVSFDLYNHSIHVWYINLHLVEFYGKCRDIYHTWMLWDNQPTVAVFFVLSSKDFLTFKGRAVRCREGIELVNDTIIPACRKQPVSGVY